MLLIFSKNFPTKRIFTLFGSSVGLQTAEIAARQLKLPLFMKKLDHNIVIEPIVIVIPPPI